MMKLTIISRTLLGTGLLFFFALMCNGQDVPSDQLAGKWTKQVNGRTASIDLISDHTYQVEFAGDEGVDVTGSWTITGKQITFKDEGGAYSSGTSGKYEFTLSGTSLTFKKVDDPVTGRSMLVEGNWSKAKDEAN
jgi:hypothetical protein